MKFTIKGELTDLNTFIRATRTNKYASASIKKDETTRCAWEIKRAKLAPPTLPVFIVYRWYCKNRRKDQDNVSSMGRKFINDAMVEVGLIPNDGWNEISGWRDEFFIDSKNPRIEVIIK